MKNKYLLPISFLLLFAFQGYSQCLENTHTPFTEDSWLSCQMSANPNPERPQSHWIMYDLGHGYILDSTYIWNFNTWGMSNIGIREAAFDYSFDGINWTSLDTFTVAEASASVKYQGAPGPVFNEDPVRYVLITALSNWGSTSCAGLSEIKFDIKSVVSNDPEPFSDHRMVVTPNPVENIANVSIKSDEVPERVALYDLSGRMLEERNTILSSNLTFQMKGLPGGVYFVKAWIGESVLTEKIVKVR